MREINNRILWIIIIPLIGIQNVFTQNKPTITIRILMDGDKKTVAITSKLEDELSNLLQYVL